MTIRGSSSRAAASDPLGSHFDRRSVHTLDIDPAVGIDDPHFAAGAQRIGVGPLLGGPRRQVPQRHVAAGEPDH